MLDPDWFTPHATDYLDTYGDDDGEAFADTDALIRFRIETGRPGYAYDPESES